MNNIQATLYDTGDTLKPYFVKLRKTIKIKERVPRMDMYKGMSITTIYKALSEGALFDLQHISAEVLLTLYEAYKQDPFILQCGNGSIEYLQMVANDKSVISTLQKRDRDEYNTDGYAPLYDV